MDARHSSSIAGDRIYHDGYVFMGVLVHLEGFGLRKKGKKSNHGWQIMINKKASFQTLLISAFQYDY